MSAAPLRLHCSFDSAQDAVPLTPSLGRPRRPSGASDTPCPTLQWSVGGALGGACPPLASSCPAQSAGDALGERASASRTRHCGGGALGGVRGAQSKEAG
jgi:hypothetical protein